MATPHEMWQCQAVNCGYIYNPDKGDRKGKIPPGTKFEDLPDDWTCPICGAGKDEFEKEQPETYDSLQLKIYGYCFFYIEAFLTGCKGLGNK